MTMKTLRILLTALPLMAGAAVHAADSNHATNDKASRVQVTFSHPEKFTDVREDQFGSDKGRDAILGVLRDYLQDEAPRFLAPGQRLSVTFTDVDLAGDFEPWRGPQSDQIRIVKSVYPPRMDLSFQLTDANGAVIKEGTRQLRDLNFEMAININREDPLRFEKNLLNDWMRREFPRNK